MATFQPENFRLTSDDVCGLAFLAGWGFGPGFLEADINCGVDDGALRDFGAREEDEFRLVEDSLGWDLRFVVRHG